MSKQDRTFLRTPTDLERKYDFSKIGQGGGGDSAKVSQLEQTLAQHMVQTENKFSTMTEEIGDVRVEVESIEPYTLPKASTTTLGGVMIGENVEIDKNGKISVPVVNGADGKDGYTPQKNVDYFDGKDGISPSVSVTEISGGHRVTITDANSTKEVDVMNGADGKDGANGIDGKDGANGKDGTNGADGKDGANGVSVVSVVQTIKSNADGGTNVITVTLSNGTTSTFQVKNGSKGSSGASPSDYVVAQGTSGKWKYRKWNSGLAECWASVSASISSSSWTAWGSNYYADISSACYVPYPFTFTDTPIELKTLKGSSGNQMWMSLYASTDTDRCVATTYGTYAIRSTKPSATVTPIIDYYVVGIWK